ncbi:diol dehydratase small subunit|uniref:Propanediol dehydratase small subunit n=1 Tax=Dendrosporobacter quercicolus TaxID=146817 RepID=A0A1G9Q9I3_9FIRM|nr:diol dehydratase small subunit [Dendrosporobacter quercicolus]NSL48148.1 diol dehydratase small subunit [Dendrosporobacter quercicolus DSM 1736]SDM07127.1 propanediol dehydratase small subunit [Dendrosporobacter quercicolus]
MSQQQLVEDIIREVLKTMHKPPQAVPVAGAPAAAAGAKGLNPASDYPLAAKRPELVKSPTGKSLAEITMDKVLHGDVKAEDVRISPDTLRLQAEIADGVGRTQLANNMRRAAELTAIPDERILEIYNALRPYRSTKAELLAIADELDARYGAKINAAFVREAAGVYERRNRLRAD